MAQENNPSTYKTGFWLNKDNKMVMVHAFMTPNAYRIFNFFLLKAVKEGKFQELSAPAIEVVKMANIKDSAYSTVLHTESKRIMATMIDMQDATGNWKLRNLVSDMEYTDGVMTCSFHPRVQEMMNSKQGFTHIGYSQMVECSSYPAMRLYEVCQRWEDTGFALYTVEEWRNLLGATKKSYEIMAQFKRRIILPAVKEVNETTSLIISPEYITSGRKTTHIKMHIKSKSETAMKGLNSSNVNISTVNHHTVKGVEEAGQQQLSAESLTPQEQEVAERMRKKYKLAQPEEYIKQYGVLYCQAQMEYVRQVKKAGNARNTGGYLKKALDNDYAGHLKSLEKADQAEAAEHKDKALWDKQAKAFFADKEEKHEETPLELWEHQRISYTNKAVMEAMKAGHDITAAREKADKIFRDLYPEPVA